MARHQTDAHRFLAKVLIGDGCWQWVAPHRDGYGRFYVSGRMVLAHRYAYELLVGPIPQGLTLDHLCRNKACVRPDHLEPVTHRENCIRRSANTHCQRGHPFDAGNTYVQPDGVRICRACRAVTWKKYYAGLSGEQRERRNQLRRAHRMGTSASEGKQ